MSPPSPSPSPGTEMTGPGLRGGAHRFWNRLVQTARLSIGVGDYEAYVAHQRAQHPDQPLMSYAEFFRSRQDARYGKGTSRCC